VGASEATDLAERKPGAAERRRSVNRLLGAGFAFVYFLLILKCITYNCFYIKTKHKIFRT
jgi:hypothetical protein